MSIFKKAIKEAKEFDEVVETTHTNPTPPEEEWVWVEGYKGTDKNMCCRGFQYEMDKQFDMPEGIEIHECQCGFHLCLTLDDTLQYYTVGGGRRFFKVQALVRKSDIEKYDTEIHNYIFLHTEKHNKLVAKSIIFTSELTINDILKVAGGEDLPEQYKQLAIEGGIQYAYTTYHTDLLIEDGYSKPFASHIVNNKLFDAAHAIGSQKDLSMDMKVLYILNKS